MFVHSADKLAEMRTKFHVIQAKLIMSVWCFTVHCDIGEPLPLDPTLASNSCKIPNCRILHFSIPRLFRSSKVAIDSCQVMDRKEWLEILSKLVEIAIQSELSDGQWQC